MKNTSRFASFFVIAALGIGCGSSDDTTTPVDTGTAPVDTGTAPTDTGTKTDTGTAPTDTGTADTGTAPTDTGADTGGFPAPPTIGAQIDRMGRPAVNTALNHAFDATETTKQAAKDDWNTNSDPSTWSTKYLVEVESNLAILDSLDTNCGNQAFADKTKTDKSRYATLGGVLVDDRLWVKSDATTCTTYLAVEANATALLANADCGGRSPSYDPIKETYSLLAIGALSGITDGVTPTPDRAKVTTFPYLAAPH